MVKRQRWAMIAVTLMALLALPVFVMVAFLTAPFGMMLFVLKGGALMNLYPFMYAGTGEWNQPVYYLSKAISLPITIVQWVVIGWLSSFVLGDFKSIWIVLGALAVVIVVGALTSLILSAAGITLMSLPVRM